MGGLWQVIDFVVDEENATRAQYSGDAHAYNLWGRWSMRHQPLIAKTPRPYDSGDSANIREHLRELTEASVDFLIFDETNRLQCGQSQGSASWICPRSLQVAEQIVDWNQDEDAREIKFALACVAESSFSLYLRASTAPHDDVS